MLNHIVLMGRLTRDVELRTTQSDVSVASFTLACDRDFGGRSVPGRIRRATSATARRSSWTICILATPSPKTRRAAAMASVSRTTSIPAFTSNQNHGGEASAFPPA